MNDAQIIFDLIEAFRRSKTMFAALDFGVFDYTPATLEELATKIGANADALERLLDACRSLGLLTKEDGVYRNTSASETYLKRTSPQSFRGYATYSNHVLYPLWAHLEDAVKEGSHRWKQGFNLDGPIFDHFFRTPEARFEFLSGMHSYGAFSSPGVAAAFDLSEFSRMVDLGGGTGHLAMAVADRYPHIRTAVFDLPGAIETARHFVSDRVELIAGDFFKDPLPPADLYVLGRILHDWTPQKIGLLLSKIVAALPPGGGLLIAEKLLLDDKSGPVWAHMQSLNMLVCTEGKERNVIEYRQLLEEAGLEKVNGAQTSLPIDAVLARKPGKFATPV